MGLVSVSWKQPSGPVLNVLAEVIYSQLCACVPVSCCVAPALRLHSRSDHIHWLRACFHEGGSGPPTCTLPQYVAAIHPNGHRCCDASILAMQPSALACTPQIRCVSQDAQKRHADPTELSASSLLGLCVSRA